jgi:hypothetical protein
MSGSRFNPIVIEDDNCSRASTPALELVRHSSDLAPSGLRWNSAFRGGVPVMNQLQAPSQPSTRSADPRFRFCIYVELCGSEASCLFFLLGLASLIVAFIAGHF